MPDEHLAPALATNSMKILSLNVGLPKEVQAGRALVVTSIFKEPVEGRRAVKRHNIDGDRQADLTVHGGPYKAIYCYPNEHYAYWSRRLPEFALPFGVFGENLTTEGLTEESVCIGDQYRVGTAILQVSQPRMPCFKLAIRFGRADMVKLFWQSGLSGIYFSIVEEGDLSAGDSIQHLSRIQNAISVADIVRLHRGEERHPDLVQRAMQAPLYGSWKRDIRERQNQAELF
jgi:MOSC domain-containing protein YiiM